MSPDSEKGYVTCPDCDKGRVPDMGLGPYCLTCSGVVPGEETKYHSMFCDCGCRGPEDAPAAPVSEDREEAVARTIDPPAFKRNNAHDPRHRYDGPESEMPQRRESARRTARAAIEAMGSPGQEVRDRKIERAAEAIDHLSSDLSLAGETPDWRETVVRIQDEMCNEAAALRSLASPAPGQESDLPWCGCDEGFSDICPRHMPPAPGQCPTCKGAQRIGGYTWNGVDLESADTWEEPCPDCPAPDEAMDGTTGCPDCGLAIKYAPDVARCDNRWHRVATSPAPDGQGRRFQGKGHLEQTGYATTDEVADADLAARMEALAVIWSNENYTLYYASSMAYGIRKTLREWREATTGGTDDE